MIHLNDPEIRALIDSQLGAEETGRARTHLESCPACHQRFTEIKNRMTWVESVVTGSGQGGSSVPVSAEAAYRRFSIQSREFGKEGKTMSNSPLIKRLRPAFIGLAALVAILGLFAFPQVRAAAVDFLGLFRVQQVAVVEVDPRNLPDQLGSSNIFEELIANNVVVEDLGEAQELKDPAEAVSQAGFAVRLPERAPAEGIYRLQAGSRVTFNVDLSQVKDLMSEIGYGSVEIPEEIDGVEVTLSVQPSLATAFGSCRMDELFDEQGEPIDARLQGCIMLVQTPSPTISAPEGLNLPEIGKAFLQVMGLSAEEAEEFSRTVDWATTLVIPIPRYGSSYRTVQVDGVDGTLIQQDIENHLPNYMLIWVKDGILYTISGQGNWQDGVSLGNSLN
jgi:hypothetical protein